MSEYREDLIPVEYILEIAEKTGIGFAKISLLALVDNWHQYGEVWCEAQEVVYHE